ncbi:MAG: septum formation initiator family protein [Lachnospiraceae bacterium]
MSRKRQKRKSGLKIIAIAVLILCAVVTYSRVALEEERRALEKQYAELSEQLLKEQERAELLLERERYMQTLRYIEETAREKLGLVYEDEIIFRPEEEEK